jgi:xanthine dehydrogenase small subunit
VAQRPVRFYLNDQLQSLAAVPPTRTVLEWLREDRHLTGTKEGCAEGDCGACTVVIGERVDEDGVASDAMSASERAGRMRYRAINSCITFVAALDGKQLITVEHLRGAGGALHPVQQALVDQHASQCGFCTPGFVMSLYALYQDKRQQEVRSVARAEAAEALAGNLCRCTGYRPILDAAQAMTSTQWVAPDEATAAQNLAALAAEPALEHHSDSGVVHAPRTLAELLHLRAGLPAARLVAGSTDVGLWVTKQHRELRTLILTGRVAELLSMQQDAQALTIGAAVPLTDALARLTALFPATRDYWQRYGSPPVRNSGTLGGNLANGSPIGDSMPVLIALGAEVVLASLRGERCLPLEQFYLSYQRTALQADEVLRAVRVPLPAVPALVRAYKLSKRFDQDISALALGIAVQLDGAVLREVRIGLGGMAAVPSRAHATEAALRGRRFDAAALSDAQVALAGEFSPISDMRASAAYRRQAAQNLLRRAWHELSPLAPPTPALTVHAVHAEQARVGGAA